MAVGHGGATMVRIAKVFIEGFPVEFLVLMGGVQSSELQKQWTGGWRGVIQAQQVVRSA